MACACRHNAKRLKNVRFEPWLINCSSPVYEALETRYNLQDIRQAFGGAKQYFVPAVLRYRGQRFKSRKRQGRIRKGCAYCVTFISIGDFVLHDSEIPLMALDNKNWQWWY